jgi:Tfp pilus assembly protein PilN
MKAVNLIPEDLRGFSGGGAQSGTPVYGLLGVLAALVVLVAAWALVDRQVADRKAEIVKVESEARAAEARAAQLAPYTTFARISKERVGTVRDVAASRFDWAGALREVSRLVPEGVYLTSMTGTTAPGVGIEGGSGNPLRASMPVPALEIVGCAPGQEDLARLLPRLRAMGGVERVSLASSEKGEMSGGTGGGGGSADCRQGTDTIPQFNLVVFFKAAPAAPAAAAAGATTPAAAAATTPAAPAAPATGAPR